MACRRVPSTHPPTDPTYAGTCIHPPTNPPTHQLVRTPARPTERTPTHPPTQCTPEHPPAHQRTCLSWDVELAASERAVSVESVGSRAAGAAGAAIVRIGTSSSSPTPKSMADWAGRLAAPSAGDERPDTGADPAPDAGDARLLDLCACLGFVGAGRKTVTSASLLPCELSATRQHRKGGVARRGASARVKGASAGSETEARGKKERAGPNTARDLLQLYIACQPTQEVPVRLNSLPLSHRSFARFHPPKKKLPQTTHPPVRRSGFRHLLLFPTTNTHAQCATTDHPPPEPTL